MKTDSGAMLSELKDVLVTVLGIQEQLINEVKELKREQQKIREHQEKFYAHFFGMNAITAKNEFVN